MVNPAIKTPLFACHRVILMLIAFVMVAAIIYLMRWDWLPNYSDKILLGLWRTLWLLVSSIILGFLLAVPLRLVQVTWTRP